MGRLYIHNYPVKYTKQTKQTTMPQGAYVGNEERDWTVFRIWKACFNLTHAQHLVLLQGIIVVTNLKLISETENDSKSYRGQFIFLFYKIEKTIMPKKNCFFPIAKFCFLFSIYSLNILKY